MRWMLTLVALSATVQAAPLKGRIEDPAVRRKAQLVYVEKVASPAAPPAAPVFMNQKGLKYVPHLLPVVAGTQIIFRSADAELHNVYARGPKKVLFNDAVLPNMQSQPKRFDEPGAVHLTCNVHKEMSAWIVVLQNSFFAIPEKDGSFTIEGLPAGTYTVRVWGEELSDEQKAKTMTITVAEGAS
jgi:plastocyanin